MQIKPLLCFHKSSARSRSTSFDGLSQRKAALVQCTSDNAAYDREPGQPLHVAQLADSTRSNHRRPHRMGQRIDCRCRLTFKVLPSRRDV